MSPKPTCLGGQTGQCTTDPTWRVRAYSVPDWRIQDSPPGSPGPYWDYACGRHLHYIASETTEGEQMTLVLERIRTDES